MKGKKGHWYNGRYGIQWESFKMQSTPETMEMPKEEAKKEEKKQNEEPLKEVK